MGRRVTTLAEKNAALRAKLQIEPTPEFPNTLADLDKGKQRSPIDDELDSVLDAITIDEAYRRWCGKMEPIDNGRVEGVSISCPIPGHADTHPSAWMNTAKRTWYCGACDSGGDLFDIAAFHFGYDVPGYKGTDFPKLRQQMAESFGYHVKKSAAGTAYLSEAPAPQPVVEPGSDVAQSIDNIIEFPLPMDLQPLPIDWRSLLPADTFLEQWMQATSADDLPEEYYFWLGLMAVGLAAGEQTVLADDPQIKGNLYVCLYGPSGIGKTRSSSRLVRLLNRALPYDPDDPHSTGTMHVPMPGSAEALIDAFSKPIFDPNDPKKIMGYNGVRGLIRFDEMSSLIGRANRVGSAIKPTLMEFFDSYNAIDIVSRGAGRARAEHHFAASVVSTQPGAIRDILVQADADSGFINRWVFASGPLKPLRSYRSAAIDLEPLIAPLNALRQWSSLRYREIELNDDAREAWNTFFQATIEPIRTSNEKPLLTRVDLLMKKLILLFCINEKLNAPTAELVERVISLFPYIERSYNLLVGEIGVGPQQECRERILNAIHSIEEKTGNAVTTRQINQRLGKKFSLDMIVKTLAAMTHLGDILEDIRTPARGPKTVVYRSA